MMMFGLQLMRNITTRVSWRIHFMAKIKTQSIYGTVLILYLTVSKNIGGPLGRNLSELKGSSTVVHRT